MYFQALSMLLNATPFAFVIDLACLASRREYLKLDKWLSDKIREHGVKITAFNKINCLIAIISQYLITGNFNCLKCSRDYFILKY